MKRAAHITAFLLVALLAGSLRASFGDGGDYGGGSSGDGSSGGSSGGSSSSDWSSSSWDSGSGGGGGGGGGGPPGPVGFAITVVLVAAYCAWMIWLKSKPRKSGYIAPTPQPAVQPNWHAPLLSVDPNFSRTLFLDFANLVFVKFHEARGQFGRREAITPWLAPGVRNALASDTISIDGVVVGGRFVRHAWVDNYRSHIVVVYLANLFENRGGTRTRVFVEQGVTFSRPNGLLTQEPQEIMRLGCPNCGSGEEPRVSGACPSCGQIAADGSRNWQVMEVSTRRYEVKGPEQRRIGHFNRGLELPTVTDVSLGTAHRDLAVRDPEFSLEHFRRRAGYIFQALQNAWSARDTAMMRPFLSDGLFTGVRFQLARQDEQRLRTVIADVAITRIDIAKIEHDAWFDAITARILCEMMDYTLDAQGALFKGDNKAKRRFSEYWTFLRRSGARQRGVDPSKCPSCGAPLDKINAAGVCEYCNSKVVSGEFDWVLCQIDQDEEYRG